MIVSAATGPSIRYRVSHRTEYRYSVAMIDGFTVAHLLPRSTANQRVEQSELRITPEPDEYQEHEDAFGNRVVRIGVHRPHDRLEIVAESTAISTPFRPETSVTWEAAVAAVPAARGDLALDVGTFAAITRSTPVLPALAEFTDPAFTPGRPIVDAVAALCHHINQAFVFDSGFSDVSTPIGAVLDARRGVCQDFAHVTIACLRSVGLAARYISGYIETFAAPGAVKLVGVDASHAWCSVWAPGVGWFDLDPTNDQMPPANHITTGWGRDYTDVAPVRGVVIGPRSTQSLSVAVDVTRLT